MSTYNAIDLFIKFSVPAGNSRHRAEIGHIFLDSHRLDVEGNRLDGVMPMDTFNLH